ncbi:hypothetical protein BAE44_0019048, partial [Dichanthelium oligosanthes]
LQTCYSGNPLPESASTVTVYDGNARSDIIVSETVKLIELFVPFLSKFVSATKEWKQWPQYHSKMAALKIRSIFLVLLPMILPCKILQSVTTVINNASEPLHMCV